MRGFIARTRDSLEIRFDYYEEHAPVTSAAFSALLPFTRIFLHARVSGHEIWTESAPHLDIIQENASVFTLPGEVVFGPSKPARALTRNAMGIYYGEGRGLDACNIFARAIDDDRVLLNTLGEMIWRDGMQEITFEKHP